LVVDVVEPWQSNVASGESIEIVIWKERNSEAGIR
jgi:hypothetical protein